MTKALLAIALLALPGCSARLPDGSPAPASAGTKEVRERSGLLDFTYSWPAEAAAIPVLDTRFEADAATQRDTATEVAEEDRAARGADAPFHGHYFSQAWAVYGNSPRLLSLAARVDSYTGGAHGNSTYRTLLWDRSLGREIDFATLLADAPATFAAMTPAYCTALDRQRAEKREESLPLGGEGWMIECPPLAEQDLVPADLDKDGRFDTLRVLIPPYGAGPYSEGSYEVDVPSGGFTRFVRPGYSAEFGS